MGYAKGSSKLFESWRKEQIARIFHISALLASTEPVESLIRSRHPSSRQGLVSAVSLALYNISGGADANF
jgi:hypothetical protein